MVRRVEVGRSGAAPLVYGLGTEWSTREQLYEFGFWFFYSLQLEWGMNFFISCSFA